MSPFDDLHGVWEVNDSYIDRDTGLWVTETHTVEGDLRDAFENVLFHRQSADVRIRYRGAM